MNIGKNVKRLRTQMGMTQKALAEKVGVNHTMIGHIENGAKIPSLVVALDMAKTLGCTVEALCYDDKE